MSVFTKEIKNQVFNYKFAPIPADIKEMLLEYTKVNFSNPRVPSISQSACQIDLVNHPAKILEFLGVQLSIQPTIATLGNWLQAAFVFNKLVKSYDKNAVITKYSTDNNRLIYRCMPKVVKINFSTEMGNLMRNPTGKYIRFFVGGITPEDNEIFGYKIPDDYLAEIPGKLISGFEALNILNMIIPRQELTKYIEDTIPVL